MDGQGYDIRRGGCISMRACPICSKELDLLVSGYWEYLGFRHSRKGGIGQEITWHELGCSSKLALGVYEGSRGRTG